jgi:hypothetical protein
MKGQAKSSPNHPRREEKSYPTKHNEQYNTRADKAEREGNKMKGMNPDRGPPMMWGEHKFDKGYESDADVFARSSSYPGDEQRGNEYVQMNREIIHRDTKALNRDKFSKIA